MKEDWVLRFQEALSADWAWRLREINDYKQVIKNAPDEHCKTICRMGVLLLYSHWEGFIKKSAICFVNNFVGEKFINVPPYIMVAHYIISHHRYSSKMQNYECGKKVLCELDDESVICFDIKNIIKTESNLNYKVFSQLLPFLGVGIAEFELREKYINNFVNCRHGIAHGEKREVTKDDVMEYFTGVVNLINLYKKNLLNVAESISNIGC